jgi:hypothetical protein
MQSQEGEAQPPDFPWRLLTRQEGVGQIIPAWGSGVTLRTLTSRFRVLKAALDDRVGFTRWALDAVWPAQCADGLIPLGRIDQILDMDLHGWTPVWDWDMGGHQCTPSLNSTTLESNKSVTT